MRVITLGLPARQILMERMDAHLMGVTSRGAFLRTPANRVLYLSPEKHRGPLTLNLDRSLDHAGLQPGDRVLAGPEELVFAKTGLRISLSGAETWSPAPPARAALSLAEIRARAAGVAQALAQAGPAPDEAMQALRQALENRQAERAAALLYPLVGRGTGLTPAGDDFILGMLLALNRWGSMLDPDFPVQSLNERLILAAAEGTTTLSANLIECAAQGLADERLIRGLDGLVTGFIAAQVCAGYFNAWGSTSGASAFQGIRLVLSG